MLFLRTDTLPLTPYPCSTREPSKDWGHIPCLTCCCPWCLPGPGCAHQCIHCLCCTHCRSYGERGRDTWLHLAWAKEWREAVWALSAHTWHRQTENTGWNQSWQKSLYILLSCTFSLSCQSFFPPLDILLANEKYVWPSPKALNTTTLSSYCMQREKVTVSQSILETSKCLWLKCSFREG